MVSEKQLVLHALYRMEYLEGIINFDDVLSRIAEVNLGKPILDIDAFVFRNKQRLWNDLKASIDEDRQNGRWPVFTIQDDGERRFSWSASQMTRESSKKKKHLGHKLKARPYFLNTIDNLSDREFEALCCAIATFAGATKVKLTPPGNEGGIDFFALLNQPSKSHLFGGYSTPLRIVGQSKMYQERISVDKVKEFIQTVNEVKELNPAVENHVPIWFRKAKGPIVGWIVSYKGVQSGGVTKARNHGMIISDVFDLAEVAALSNKLDISLLPQTRPEILKKMVHEILLKGTLIHDTSEYIVS